MIARKSGLFIDRRLSFAIAAIAAIAAVHAIAAFMHGFVRFRWLRSATRGPAGRGPTDRGRTVPTGPTDPIAAWR